MAKTQKITTAIFGTETSVELENAYILMVDVHVNPSGGQARRAIFASKEAYRQGASPIRVETFDLTAATVKSITATVEAEVNTDLAAREK
jgi:hypothetical protein